PGGGTIGKERAEALRLRDGIAVDRLGLGDRGLHLRLLRRKVTGIDPHERLAGPHSITLLHQNGGDGAHQLGRERGLRDGSGYTEGLDDRRYRGLLDDMLAARGHLGTADRRLLRDGGAAR